MRSYERAQSVLTEHLDVLHKLAEQLLEKETILGAELDEIIRQVRPGIKLPDKPTDKEEKETAPDDTAASAPAASETTTAEDATEDQVDDFHGSTPQETDSGENTEPR
jgi:cell division protease FtsH